MKNENIRLGDIVENPEGFQMYVGNNEFIDCNSFQSSLQIENIEVNTYRCGCGAKDYKNGLCLYCDGK